MSSNEQSYSGSRGYQQSSFVNTICHSCPSRGARVTQKRGGCSGRTTQSQVSKECEGLEARIFFMDVISTLHL